MPSTTKARAVELSSRTGRIFWYSGEWYQRLNEVVSANSRITMRLGSGPALDQFGRARQDEVAAAILFDRDADRIPVGLHCGRVGDLEFDNE